MTFKALEKGIISLAAIGMVLSCLIMPAASLDINTDRPGSDYRNFDLASADPNLCASACASDPECKAFSYNPPGMSGPSARCWLKNEVSEKVAAAGVVSGVKGESAVMTAYQASYSGRKYGAEQPIALEEDGSASGLSEIPISGSIEDPKWIHYFIEEISIAHFSRKTGNIARILCYSVGNPVGELIFVETNDGASLPQNNVSQSEYGGEYIKLYYPYSRYSDILAVIRNGRNVILSIDGIEERNLKVPDAGSLPSSS